MNKPKRTKLSTTKFEAVKELRLRLGLTQQEFAQRAKLSIHTVSVYETGKTATSDGVLFRFAKLAIEHGHKDLAEVLTSGHPVETVLDVNEIADLQREFIEARELLAQAEAKVRAATDRLGRRLEETGIHSVMSLKTLEVEKVLLPKSSQEKKR